MEQYPQKISSLYAAVSDFESELIVHQSKLLATTCNPELQAPERFNAQNAAINYLTEGNSGGVTELSREVHYVICEKSQAETGAANRKLLKQGDVVEAGSEEQYVGSEKPQAETQCGELEQAKQAEVEAGFSSSATGHGDAADEQAAAGTSISRLPPPSPSTSSPPQRSCSPAVPDSLTTEADISGVTVSFLRIFVQEHELRLKDMTTAEVCSELIKAETDSERISYVELLRRTGKGAYVGDAIRFISHAWACKFLALVETIFEECEKEGLDESKCPVWLDIFTVNQHSGIEDFDHWTTSFQLAIRKIGKAWIIFVPYLPVWLTRAWCLFELYAIVEGGLQFEILLPWSEEEKFTHFLKGGGKVEDAISQIDVRKAEAFKQSDKDNINRIVAASMGHGKLNELVTTEMRKWFVSSAEFAMAKMQQDEKLTSELHLNTIKMYITLGRLADADSELENRRQTQLALLGAESLKVAETMCELGTVKWKLGQLEVALSVEEEARLIYEKAAAEDLELLGNITNRIGAVLHEQGKYELAMQSYTESLAIKTQWYGPEHAAVASTHVNIGNVYQRQGDNEKALFHFNTALPVLISQLGSSHAAVAVTEMNIGNVLSEQGDNENALVHLQKALKIQEVALGPSHADVASTKDNIGIVLKEQGKLNEALKFHEEALQIRRTCFSDSHVSVAMTLGNMALVHSALGQKEQAIMKSSQAHKIFLENLGPDHPSTKLEARNLARLT